ncbi:hypothetical protein [Planctomycetes bacterium K23_9]|uniref:Uncharacterized protein n=1 Tax=Stieleria marina TaxID=1930275 RepID=A0A517NT83_9BACT|nr:hypothetical protein K239x_22890 [Planctomycetes bacterium K23_9]
MSKNLSRRHLMLLLGATAIPATGCSTEDVQNAVDELDTETLETASVALRGYAIVSCLVGQRVVTLPAPGVRVLAVFLIVSGVASKLVIEYLDVELRKRHVTETLSEEESKTIESDLLVTFQLESGETETVQLGPNQYDKPPE